MILFVCLELENLPSFIDGLIDKLGLEPEPEVEDLPPCTILKPVANEGEAVLPAILLPGIDHDKAIELLEDENIQSLLKSLAEKHRVRNLKHTYLKTVKYANSHNVVNQYKNFSLG
jgi:hypothetical protein